VIEKIKSCKNALELFTALSAIDNWSFGKCELYHWIDVLDIFDHYLELAAQKVEGSKWQIALDSPDNEMVMHSILYFFITRTIHSSLSLKLLSCVTNFSYGSV
jgi:E3 ubiquitin-protein ligase HUWE1